jgi:hypothetical protein
MSAIQFMSRHFREEQAGLHNSWQPEGRTSAGTTLVELGAWLGKAAALLDLPGQCAYCRIERDLQTSTAGFPQVFCSELCEQEFVRAALASLTLEDCLRMQERLERLFGESRDGKA